MHTLLLLLAITNVPPVLQRAAQAAGGSEALARARAISIFLVGTQDSSAIAQGYFAEKPSPRRHQETLILDLEKGRAALRSEGVNSDGSPTSWRWLVTPEGMETHKLKTGGITRSDLGAARTMMERLRWTVPHLALADMLAHPEKLQCDSATVCRFETADGLPFRITFDAETGHIAHYEYDTRTMTGMQTARFAFKPWMDSGIGRYPSGYRMTIDERVFRDMDVIDARPAVFVEEHAWLTSTPTDPKPQTGVRIGSYAPASVEQVADGVFFMRNVGGQNVMFARAGDCVAVVDAPASFGHQGGPLPTVQSRTDHAQVITDKVKEATGLDVCYVIPTHHHGDHFGLAGELARRGATIVTSPANEALAARVAAAAGVASPRLLLVRDKLTLGSGASRLDVWLVRNDPHVEEMLFVHFPQHRIVFEGDISDYVPSAWNFLRFAGRNRLAVDRVFHVHSATPGTLANMQYENPGN